QRRQYDTVEDVRARQRTAVLGEQQRGGTGRVVGEHVVPAQFLQRGRDVHTGGGQQLPQRCGQQLAVAPVHQAPSAGSRSTRSATMPRCTSAAPPNTVVARLYHHRSRQPSSSPVSPSRNSCGRRSRTTSSTACSAWPSSTLSTLVSTPTVSPAASRPTVRAAWARTASACR